jgi:hypothetical protein
MRHWHADVPAFFRGLCIRKRASKLSFFERCKKGIFGGVKEKLSFVGHHSRQPRIFTDNDIIDFFFIFAFCGKK